MIHKESWYGEVTAPRPPSKERDLDLLIQKYLHDRSNVGLREVITLGRRFNPGRQKIVNALVGLSRTELLNKFETKVMWSLSKGLPEYPAVSAENVVYCPWPEYLPQIEIVEVSFREENFDDEDSRSEESSVKEMNLSQFLKSNYHRFGNRGGESLIWHSASSNPEYAANPDYEEGEEGVTYSYDLYLKVPTPQKRKQLFDWWEEKY